MQFFFFFFKCKFYTSSFFCVELNVSACFFLRSIALGGVNVEEYKHQALDIIACILIADVLGAGFFIPCCRMAVGSANVYYSNVQIS